MMDPIFTIVQSNLHMEIDGFEAALFYFLLYSFAGWLIENFYSLGTTGVFMKEGFLQTPLKPMYGFAPLLLLKMLSLNSHWAMVIIFCFTIPTIVEYISGVLLQTFFRRKWWDYSSMPFQLNGHICLQFSLYWLVLSFLALHFIHPFVASVYSQISYWWTMVYPVVLIIFLSDFTFTFWHHYKKGHEAIELKD